MLTNWLPLAAMTQEEKELFVGLSDWYCLQSEIEHKEPVWAVIGSKFCLHRQSSNIIPRLKLKEGEWYSYKTIDDPKLKCAKLDGTLKIGMVKISCGEWSDVEDIDKITLFRPATQEEIDSVKPKETFVDVEINWDNLNYETPACDTFSLRNSAIGRIDSDGWMVDCFIIDGVKHHMPAVVENHKEFTGNKAQFVRFVKVGE